MEDFIKKFLQFQNWSNANDGFLSILLFVVAIFFGWASGIFSSLIHKPKFRIEKIDGPTFLCTYGNGGKRDGYDTHNTAICLYLYISNIGSAPSSIHRVSVGYHWCLTPLSIDWIRYGLGWFWLREQTTALQDFSVSIGDHTKVYPFLFQMSSISGKNVETYLEIGKSVNGVVYFEQRDSYGGCFPVSYRNESKIIVEIEDSYGRRYRKKLSVHKIKLAEARKYNPSFGLTHFTISGRGSPMDLPTDEHGNLLPPNSQAFQR